MWSLTGTVIDVVLKSYLEEYNVELLCTVFGNIKTAYYYFLQTFASVTILHLNYVFYGFCRRDIPQNISLKQNGTLKAYVKDTTNGVCPQEPDEISLNYTDRNLICFCQSVHAASCKVFFLYFYPSRARPTSYVLPWWDLRAITASPKAYRKWKTKWLC